jgi:8-oxo-dGTP pyrophosphatase MutT (NUDIX family)
MMTSGPDISDLELVLSRHGSAQPSSDFDLNPRASRPEAVTKRPAAVLVPIVERPGGPYLILTKRSAALKYHPGQISFPGGKVEPSDQDPLSAALREAEEEIGLPRHDVRVFGALPSHETVTRFDVFPFLGQVPADSRWQIDYGEVAEVFEVPLAHVIRPENFVVHDRLWQGRVRRYYAVPFGPYYIWGATARILRQLADMLDQAHAD